MNLKLRQPSLAKMAPDQLPTPPLELMEYAEKGDAHLANGLADYLSMKKAALSLGYDVSGASRALDFGCANGRVTRWFENIGQREVWGCDIQAAKIFWALENLSPPLKFSVNSKEAHLPFPDGYFGFISAMSIFTHLNANHIPDYASSSANLRHGISLATSMRYGFQSGALTPTAPSFRSRLPELGCLKERAC